MHFKVVFLFTLFLGAAFIISFSYLQISKNFATKITHVNFQQINLSESIEDKYINIVGLSKSEHNFLKGTLRNGGRTMVIYVYDRKDMISNSILTHGVWEGWLVDQFVEYLRSKPGIQVLDAGSNIGVYSLVSAAFGANVVSVDANPNNTARLAQSVIENGFNNKVKICLNALTNVRKEYSMTRNDANIGSQNILESVNDPSRVKSIFIDDLTVLFNVNDDVMIKIDIEGREIEAFKKANYFFSVFNVRAVLIEWEWIKSQTDISYLLNFFISRNFKPFKSFHKTESLEVTEHLSWPMDVVWIKS